MPTWRVLTKVDVTVPGALPAIDVLVASPAAARTRAIAEKALPWVRRASIHFCPHAAGEPASAWFSCRDPRAQYEEL